MKRNKAFKIFLNIFTVIALWFFIAGFANIFNTLNSESLYKHGETVEGEVVRYYLRGGSSSSRGAYTIYFVCKYNDPKTGKAYFAETATTPHRYAADTAKKIGEEHVGDKINLVISGSLCTAQRDTEWGYISNILITVFFTVGGAAVIAARVVYELKKDKRKNNIKAAEQSAELSGEAGLY